MQIAGMCCVCSASLIRVSKSLSKLSTERVHLSVMCAVEVFRYWQEVCITCMIVEVSVHLAGSIDQPVRVGNIYIR